MSEEIKPCPFCNHAHGKGVLSKIKDDKSDDDTYFCFVKCKCCRARGPVCAYSGPIHTKDGRIIDFGLTFEEASEIAIRAWNKSANSDK